VGSGTDLACWVSWRVRRVDAPHAWRDQALCLGNEEGSSVTIPEPLLRRTLERFVSPVAAIVDTELQPLVAGLSGAPIHRVRVRYRDDQGVPHTTTLIVKVASRIERRVLDRLQHLSPRHVPFSHTFADDADNAALVCLQDLGSRTRPYSLDPIDPVLQRCEAEALAHIHLAHRHAPDLDWLPMADATYVAWAMEQFFRPTWERARQVSRFRAHFGPVIAAVEHQAATIVAAMTDLHNVTAWRTLVHTDLNPSNVLVWKGAPYLIDWGTAHVGALFLDLPHHFPALAQAEVYRIALAERGWDIDPGTFADAHCLAARYTGLRYLWWALEAWLEDPAAERWVRHYLGMILMPGADARQKRGDWQHIRP
jgi:hypothetical protein